MKTSTDTPKEGDVTQSISEGYFSPYQRYIIFVCLLINLLDGFDVFAISFAAPLISDAFNLSPSMLGLILSASLVGMALGALLIGPLADRYGRRPIILTGLLCVSLSMIATAYATSANELMFYRFLAGLGIGGLLPGLNTICAEYAPSNKRNIALGMMHIAYPLGALTCGFIFSAYSQENWQTIFLIGGTLTFAAALIGFAALPESIHFLCQRQPKDALQKLNAILHRINKPHIECLPKQQNANPSSFRDVLSPKYLTRSIALSMSFFLGFLIMYFVFSWAPKIIVDAGLSLQNGISLGLTLNLGGIFGVLLLSYSSTYFGLRPVMLIYLMIGILSTLIFSQMPLTPTLIWVCGFVMGFAIVGSVVGYYTLAASLFPTELRASGLGFGIGIGRLGAILGPYVAGMLISIGWERGSYTLALATLPFILLIGLNALVLLRKS